MKKIVSAIMIFIVFFITIAAFTPNIYASSSVVEVSTYLKEDNQLENEINSELVEMKSKTENELHEYEELYGSKTYGYTAYVLNKIRIFSIPLCFIGIAVGSIYQYVIGIRKMDVRDKGFGLIIAFVTVLVICQLLPLIFAIVVQGWRE